MNQRATKRSWRKHWIEEPVLVTVQGLPVSYALLGVGFSLALTMLNRQKE
jgi:hypothetical protein